MEVSGKRFILFLALALYITLHRRAEAAEEEKKLPATAVSSGKNLHLCFGKNDSSNPCLVTMYIGEAVGVNCPAGSTLEPADWNKADGQFCKTSFDGQSTPKCPDGDKAKWETYGVKVMAAAPYVAMLMDERSKELKAAQKAHVSCVFAGGSDKNFITMVLTPTRRPLVSGFLHTCNTFMQKCPEYVFKGDKVLFTCADNPDNPVPADLLSAGGKYCQVAPDTAKKTCESGKDKLWSDSFEVADMTGSMKGVILDATKDYTASFDVNGLCVRTGGEKLLSFRVTPDTRKDVSQRPEGTVKCDPLGIDKYKTPTTPCKGPTAGSGVLVVDCTGFNKLVPSELKYLCSRPLKDDNDTCDDAKVEPTGKVSIDMYAIGYDKDNKAVDAIRVFTPLEEKKGSFYGRCYDEKSKEGYYFAVETFEKSDKGAAYFAAQHSMVVAVGLPILMFFFTTGTPM